MHKIITNVGIMMIVAEVVFRSFIAVVLVIRTTLGHLKIVQNIVVIVSRQQFCFICSSLFHLIPKALHCTFHRTIVGV